jgi:hypothetical protein
MGYYIQPAYSITKPKPDIDYEDLASEFVASFTLDDHQVQHIKDIVNDMCGPVERPESDIQSFIEWLKDDDDSIL